MPAKAKKPIKKKKEETSQEKPPKQKIRFHLAFVVLLLSFMGLTLLSLIIVLILSSLGGSIVLGIILLLILVPLLSGFIAGRYIIKRDTWLLGIMGGLVWSGMEIGVIFISLFSVQILMPVKLVGTLEILILATLVAANVLFCLLGLRISSRPNSLLQIKATGE